MVAQARVLVNKRGVRQLPAQLTAEQAGWVLNCQQHDIPALVLGHGF